MHSSLFPAMEMELLSLGLDTEHKWHVRAFNIDLKCRFSYWCGGLSSSEASPPANFGLFESEI